MAFQNCKNMKHVRFQEESALERFERSCFQSSGLEEFAFPESAREVDEAVFKDCSNLKSVLFAENGVLDSIGKFCF